MHVILFAVSVVMAMYINLNKDVWTLKLLGRDTLIALIVMEVSWFIGSMLV